MIQMKAANDPETSQPSLSFALNPTSRQLDMI